MIRTLQRILGWAAIPNVTLWIVALQVVTYLAVYLPARGGAPPDVVDRLLLVPERVWAGEWWRLFAFLLLPPLTNPFFAFFAWYLFWLFGTSLEGSWGTFRYNLFLWIGWLATVLAALLTGQPAVTNAFLGTSVFLAFATLCPEFELRLFFLLPIRIKWLAWLTGMVLLWSFTTGTWDVRVTVLASVFNYLLFFAADLRDRIRHGFRRMRSDAVRMARPQPTYFHKCCICGITDRTHPEAEFRYCSQCDGHPCYCAEHLRSHDHLRAAEPESAEASR